MARWQRTDRTEANRARPRVAILTNYPSDHVTFRGGVETATAALLEGLRAFQEDFDFHVVSLAPAGVADARERRDGFWFYFLGVPRRPWLRPRLPYRVAKAYRELRRIDPDLVHCQDNLALALAACLGNHRRVFTVHGIKRHEAGKRSGWEFWSAQADALIERYVHRRFDAFVCISRYAAREVGGRAMTFAIPNAVGGRFFQSPTHSGREDAPTAPRLVFVGVLAPLKRPLDLLLAHAELRRAFPALETVFCGEPETAGYRGELHRRVAELGIEGARFPGRVGQDRLVELLDGATALVLPSAQENAPMVIAEAMARGVPVVATRVGGVPDMVEDGETGFLYDVGDRAALTACLRRVLEDPELARRLGKRARAVARATYAPESVAKATVEAYRRLLEADPAPVPARSPRGT